MAVPSIDMLKRMRQPEKRKKVCLEAVFTPGFLSTLSIKDRLWALSHASGIKMVYYKKPGTRKKVAYVVASKYQGRVLVIYPHPAPALSREEMLFIVMAIGATTEAQGGDLQAEGMKICQSLFGDDKLYLDVESSLANEELAQRGIDLNETLMTSY